MACVVTNLGFLGFFKYYMFAAETLNQLWQRWARAVPCADGGVAGRHFVYTFHSLTYIMDLYRGHATPAKSFTRFLGVRGVVSRTWWRGRSSATKRWPSNWRGRDHTRRGSPRAWGCSSWASPRRSCWPIRAGRRPTRCSRGQSAARLDAWFGVLAYAFQIYFDFCGYSDMAVGLGRMLGFEFLKNFDAPYRSRSITEFWQRWHISLSSVLRDYLYFPLGGNRRAAAHVHQLGDCDVVGRALARAKWNFVVWGAVHGGLVGFRAAAREDECVGPVVRVCG